MENNILDTVKRIHIIGIGGSGTFPIVQILSGWGYNISGSDNNVGSIIDKETEMGIKISIGHNANNITDDIEAIIYSAAIPDTNPEIIKAKEKSIPLITRAQALGYITRRYNNAVSIAGTHGKTTTSALLTHILHESGLSPTAVVGGNVPSIHGYGIAGQSDIMVTEACEYKETYLELSTDISVILNVDEDHLEFFGNLENIIKSFSKFAKQSRRSVIVNGDDENSVKAIDGVSVPIITFGFGKNNNYYAADITSPTPLSSSFKVYHDEEKIGDITINIPGKYNILNALAAIVAALEVGASIKDIEKNITTFRGAGRRFEALGIVGGVHIVDDYAHHPKELEAVLSTAKKMGFNTVWAVFQPFTYSRTALLLDDFAQSLSIADRVVMSKIMGGREENTYNIYTKDLGEKIDGAVWFEEFPEIAKYVMENAQPNDLVITLGCGDVYKCANLMLKIEK